MAGKPGLWKGEQGTFGWQPDSGSMLARVTSPGNYNPTHGFGRYLSVSTSPTHGNSYDNYNPGELEPGTFCLIVDRVIIQIHRAGKFPGTRRPPDPARDPYSRVSYPNLDRTIHSAFWHDRYRVILPDRGTFWSSDTYLEPLNRVDPWEIDPDLKRRLTALEVDRHILQESKYTDTELYDLVRKYNVEEYAVPQPVRTQLSGEGFWS